MNTRNSTTRKQFYSALLGAGIATTLFSGSALGFTPADSPLFISVAVKPNILTAIDNSGSMDFEVSFQSSNGLAWWNDDNESFVDGSGRLNFNISGDWNTTWRAFGYLFPNGFSGTYDSRKLYEAEPEEWLGNAVPPTINYAWARSPDYNKAFYSPNVTYAPWHSTGTTPNVDLFVNADLNATSYDPRNNVAHTLDLFSVRESGAGDTLFRFHAGMVVPKGTRWHDGASWTNANADTAISLSKNHAVSHVPATYYVRTVNGRFDPTGAGSWKDCAADIHPDFYVGGGISLYGFEKNPGKFRFQGDAAALGPDGACLQRVVLSKTSGEAQNFANWFMYYRRRHQAMRGSVVEAFKDVEGVRASAYTINNHPNNLSMLDLDTPADKTTFLNSIYKMVAISTGTPNRQAVNFAGKQFMRTDANAPIEEPCQKNSLILFTDGFSSTDTSSGVGNADGSKGAPYADAYLNTMADIAMKYYSTPLRTGGGWPADKVPVPNACDDIPLDPTLDCNDDLHMNTYGVLLNMSGLNVYDTPSNANAFKKVEDVYNPLKPAYTWPNPNVVNGTQVDDLYHACVNGRGELYNADSPSNIATEMQSAITEITEQVGSAAAVAFNTAVLTGTVYVYQARFNTSKWSGQLLAYELDAFTGRLKSSIPIDDAGLQLPGHANRNIVTFGEVAGVPVGVPFDATSFGAGQFTTNQEQDMNYNLPANGLTAVDRINFLRGDRTHEGVGAGTFRLRARETVLGDIANAAPVYVGRPGLKWPDGDGTNPWPLGPNAYSVYQNNTKTQSPPGKADREAIIWAGANDGMMHGFHANANDGMVEKAAFMPNMLFNGNLNSGLHFLSQGNYTHKYYVDSTPAITDAYVQGRTGSGAWDSTRMWRTVIVGGLGGGGKGLYALDITEPELFTPTQAGRMPLWEFDNDPILAAPQTGDVDLGFTFSRPTIVPTYAKDASGNMRWAAVVGNGYDSASCKAVLYVIFMDGGNDGEWTEGTDYLKFDTGVGSCGTVDNGMSTPTVIDLNKDRIADRVYAGDLQGNIWVIDLCNPDNQGRCQDAGWNFANRTGNSPSAGPMPLFVAKDALDVRQPITVSPEVIVQPVTGYGQLVLFGTGKYLEDIDKTAPAPPMHTAYGVWDDNNDGGIPNGNISKVERADLMQQIFEAGAGKDAQFRITGTAVPDYLDTQGNGIQWGWYLDLPDTSDGSVNGAPERVVTTPKARGQLLFFNTLVPTSAACDVGGYGYLMSVLTKSGGRPDEPIVDINGDGEIDNDDLVGGEAVTGVKTDEGVLSDPTFVGDHRYETTSTGKILHDKINSLDTRKLGRYSWEEMRNQYPWEEPYLK